MKQENRVMKGDNIATRLIDFGAAIIGLLDELPKNRTGRHVADQLLRAATSGGSNYEEARSAQSRRDFVHKVSLAAKEVRESLYWLGLIERAKLTPNTGVEPLLREATELVAILMRSAKTAKNEDGVRSSLSPVPMPGSDSQTPAPRPQSRNQGQQIGHQHGEYEPRTGGGQAPER